MRILFVLGIALILTTQLSAQAPELGYYGTIGFNAGYAQGKGNGGPTLGLVHSTVLYSIMMFEGSASRLAFFHENGSKKLNATELLMLDIGFGHTIFKNYYVGLSPFSINLTKSGDFGVSILAKARLFDKIILEGRLLPKSYSKSDVPMLKNNSYLGLHYWISDIFSVGFRYNCYNEYTNYSIMLSWNAFELD